VRHRFERPTRGHQGTSRKEVGRKDGPFSRETLGGDFSKKKLIDRNEGRVSPYKGGAKKRTNKYWRFVFQIQIAKVQKEKSTQKGPRQEEQINAKKG